MFNDVLLLVDYIFDVFGRFVFVHEFGGCPDLFLHGMVRLRIDGLGPFNVAAHLLFKLFDDLRKGDAHIVADSFRVEGEALAVEKGVRDMPIPLKGEDDSERCQFLEFEFGFKFLRLCFGESLEFVVNFVMFCTDDNFQVLTSLVTGLPTVATCRRQVLNEGPR